MTFFSCCLLFTEKERASTRERKRERESERQETRAVQCAHTKEVFNAVPSQVEWSGVKCFAQTILITINASPVDTNNLIWNRMCVLIQFCFLFSCCCWKLVSFFFRRRLLFRFSHSCCSCCLFFGEWVCVQVPVHAPSPLDVAVFVIGA